MRFSPVSVLALLAMSVSWGCSSSNDATTGGSALGDGSVGAGATSGGGGAAASGNSGLGGQTLQGVEASVASICGETPCLCSNGLDDDGDGLVDGFDSECTGPFDQDEGTFATGIPGDNIDPKWQDCFFDGNSGAGDDGCRYATECLTGQLPQTHPDCTVTDACVKFCKPMTSNGCDCFGCCTIATPGGNVNVTISGTCSLEKIDDPQACPSCEKSTLCANECGACELCPGKTEADLPESCVGTPVPDGAPPPPNYTCDNGIACSDTQPCPTAPEHYCQLGCCIQVVR